MDDPKTTPPSSTLISSSTPSPTPTSPPPKPYSTFPPSVCTYLTYLLGVTITLSTLTATIYFPLIPTLAAYFSGSSNTKTTTIQSINLTVTAYAIAQALSPALFASLADLPTLGRRPVLLGLIALYALASLGLGYTALLTLRILQSIAGSPTPALAYGIVADVAPVSERGAMLGPLLATCNALSAVGPVVGGAVAYRGGSSSSGGGVGDRVFWGLLGLAGVVLVVVGLTMPETGRGVVGNGEGRTWWVVGRRWFTRRREKGKREKEKGVVKTEKGDDGKDDKTTKTKGRWSLLDVAASFRILFHKDAFAVLWMVASSYCIYYTFQVAIPVIFDEVYGYNELEIGLVFLPGLVGMTIGGMVAGRLVDRNYAVVARRHGLGDAGDTGRKERKRGHELGDFPIEAARYRHCLGFILLETLVVIGYGWAVWLRVHPAVPIILQFFACALSTLLSHTASALLVDIFPDSSSSAYASGQLMRCGLSAASAAVVQPLVDAVGRGWYFTIFSSFANLSCAASVVVSLWKGREWRRKRFEQGR
ncbi:MFS general substrate transporter [Dichotomopilus funicola]|uniref:MFS general substrate transporter n=1 Tax=Dichotomopilus funicola TaxID=1934379 RepID=A0AAN6UVI8_9PEZI|nr:MFS general substrate transporter [Dichotomopilus funicola]